MNGDFAAEDTAAVRADDATKSLLARRMGGEMIDDYVIVDVLAFGAEQ